MAKYIDVSELPNFEVTCSDGKKYVLLPFERLLDIPTADVAEVVRCKDCEHRGTLKCPMFDYEYREWSEDYEEIDSTEDDGFCHYGERE